MLEGAGLADQVDLALVVQEDRGREDRGRVGPAIRRVSRQSRLRRRRFPSRQPRKARRRLNSTSRLPTPMSPRTRSHWSSPACKSVGSTLPTSRLLQPAVQTPTVAISLVPWALSSLPAVPGIVSPRSSSLITPPTLRNMFRSVARFNRNCSQSLLATPG